MNSSMLSLLVGAGIAGAASWMLRPRTSNSSSEQPTQAKASKIIEEVNENNPLESKKNETNNHDVGYTSTVTSKNKSSQKENRLIAATTSTTRDNDVSHESEVSPPQPSNTDIQDTSTLLSSQILKSSKLNNSISYDDDTNLNISNITAEAANKCGEALSSVLHSQILKIIIEFKLIEKALDKCTNEKCSNESSELLYKFVKIRAPNLRRIQKTIENFANNLEMQSKTELVKILRLNEMIACLQENDLQETQKDKNLSLEDKDENAEEYKSRVRTGYITLKRLGISSKTIRENSQKHRNN